MTWNEYQRRVNGYNQRQWHAWDRTRRIAGEVYNLMNNKPIPYDKYLELPTDNPEAKEAAKQTANLDFLAAMAAKGRI